MRLVFDIEANGFLDQADTVWCICVYDLDLQVANSYKPSEIEEGLAHLSAADELIGHNIIGYDLPLLEKLHGFKYKGVVTDTVIMSRLLRSDRPLPHGCPGNNKPHSLGTWGYRVGRGKPDHDDWMSFSSDMLHRCSEDVAINVLVYHALCNERQALRGVNWGDALLTEHSIATNIAVQERNGCPVDLPLCWRTRLDLQAQLLETRKQVVPSIPPVALPKSKQPTWPNKQYKKDGSPTVQAVKYYGVGFGEQKEYRTDIIVRTAPINLNSDKQVKEYLMSIGWQPTEWNFKKNKAGKPERDANGNKIKTSPKLKLESLQSCTWPEGHGEMGRQIVEYLMMGHRAGMLKGWLRDVRSDGRIEAQALPLGTPTGRMTHRKIVNVPGVKKGEDKSILKGIPGGYGFELRSCFTTAPGYTRIGIDLASCQLRALCQYMDDPLYQDQVVNGDPHQYAADLAGLSDRQDGKKMNYTILFGGGIDMVSTSLGVSKAQAEFLIKTFMGNLPALDALQKSLKRQWKEHGYIIGIDGRAIWVRAEHMLLNYLLQTMEAIIIKNFINLLIILATHRDIDFQLITTMHDECQFLVREGQEERFSLCARQAIEQINAKFKLTCPQDIDINLGATWADCH